MNEKQYRKLKEQLTLEQRLEDKIKIIDAFKRVKKGEKFSFRDIEIIQKELMEKDNSQEQSFNMNKLIKVLEKEVGDIDEDVTSRNIRLKKQTLEQNRLKRQRRLQIERDRRANHERETI